ncbi:hypothetical protein RvY_18174 [Ramazzottius varieornatus]|uniref:Uncharacterized protein n=1 Tax=Ramazzottius varieornatus TaxID=947166 RepID=A0A1D1W4R9_RAMVA|nr:hypothetical protein RvY_18174 [Ramazzottius varieornatus]
MLTDHHLGRVNVWESCRNMTAMKAYSGHKDAFNVGKDILPAFGLLRTNFFKYPCFTSGKIQGAP